ncbi:hypothetical protein [Pararhizobium sp. DWP3-4]|uniref:hypothetical protein n=1 Tax=Pararhizobium sp. DWP3-4 TaxID=2804565 RepID=UPI003CEE303A
MIVQLKVRPRKNLQSVKSFLFENAGTKKKSNVFLPGNLALQAGKTKEACMGMEPRRELATVASMTVADR